MSKTINRDTGDTLKGPRLQKLRLIYKMLEAIEGNDNIHIYGAIEFQDDVFIQTNTSFGSDTLVEQDKNFSNTATFTLNNNQVLNSLVGFLDIWIEKSFSTKNVILCFYTTREIGKESTTNFITSTGLRLPDKPMLELLSNADFTYCNYLPLATNIIKEEYKNQYSKRPGHGHSSLVNDFTQEQWKDFFKSITWIFGSSDEVELKKQILQKIKSCKFFNHTLENKEENIFSSLMELVEQRQSIKELTEKFIFGSDIKCTFFEASAVQQVKLDDPVHEMWDQLAPPSDKRNLSDKIISVCESYRKGALGILARKVSRSMLEKQDFESDRGFLAIRYRIYETCDKALDDYIAKRDNAPYTQDEVDELITYLNILANNHVKELSCDFKYPLTNPAVIDGIILELFDSCFLAFD